MKILFFVYEFPPKIFGGLGTYAYEIGKEYVKLGNSLSIVTVNWENKLKEKEKIEGIEVYRPKLIDVSPSLPLFVSDELRGWGDWLKYFGNIISYNFLGSKQISENKKYDLVVAHDWLGIIGGLIIQKELGIPLIFQFHSTEIGRQRGKGSETIKRMELLGANQADKVITVSYAMKDELIKFGIKEDKIKVAWNGVDEKKYSRDNFTSHQIKKIRKNYNISEDDFMLFFIGRLTEVKGVSKLIESMPEVLKEFPKAKLIIVGQGEQEAYLNQLINELKLKKQVKINNQFIPEEERILHYAASDLCCFPSLYEPFGIVCLEAMSMGVPVVVGAEGTSGLREQVITEGENMTGCHINPNDPKSIAWGINLILKSDRKKLGENARKRVLEFFTWEKISKWTLNIYEEVVSERKVKR